MNQKGMVETIVGSSDNYNYCSIIGLYDYPNNVVSKIEQRQPSERGLYEIIDLNSLFFNDNKIQVLQLPRECHWLDTNSFDTLLSASNLIKNSFHFYKDNCEDDNKNF